MEMTMKKNKQKEQPKLPESGFVSKYLNKDAAIAVSVSVLLGFGAYSLFKGGGSEITNSTVMITNMAGNSGGSGSVIYSSPSLSQVLTNSHVCGLAKNGALIKSQNGEVHMVTSYKQSKTHDLCLMNVSSKLPGKAILAKKAPDLFEHATVSGHPSLLPTVVTEGHFSSNLIIDVFMGMKECSQEEAQDPDLGLICMIFGGLPQLKTYETTVVTATIMPGSSGSAIYNASKELSAVVFAGSGDIGYAFAVPYEYVANFLQNEVFELPAQIPNNTIDFAALLKQQETFKEQMKTIQNNCETKVDTITDTTQKTKVQNMCKVILRDVNWRN